MKAVAVEYDANGVRVRVKRNYNGEDAAIVIGEYEHVIISKDHAQALIDAIWKAGVGADWTLINPTPAQGETP